MILKWVVLWIIIIDIDDIIGAKGVRSFNNNNNATWAYINKCKTYWSEVQHVVSEAMKKVISSFKPTTAKFYQKQYLRFCGMALNNRYLQS